MGALRTCRALVGVPRRLAPVTVTLPAAARRRGRGGAVTVSTGPAAAPVPEILCGAEDAARVLGEARRYHEQRSPVVLRGYVRDAAAVRRWVSLDYLRAAVGPDVVCDAEVGGAYNAGGRRLNLPFAAYMDYLELWRATYADTDRDPPPEQLLYLAQNDLQAFPGLFGDVPAPDLCAHCGTGKLYSRMLWLGPRGCVSPLHRDPLDNVLLQLVGRKRATLLPRDTDEALLYVGAAHGQQSNTSAVDPEDVASYREGGRHARFAAAAAAAAAAELRPGDALFVPAGWWHHMRGLDLSASVNFWWR